MGYWERNPGWKRMSWPNRSLETFLAKNHPTCKTALDAVRSILSQRNGKPVQTASQTPQMTVAEKFKQVSQFIEKELSGLNQLAGIDESQITQETRDRLAAMPLETVEQVRAWGIEWLREIAKLRGVIPT